MGVLRPSGDSQFGETHTWVVRDSRRGRKCVKWLCEARSVRGHRTGEGTASCGVKWSMSQVLREKRVGVQSLWG